jgi:hypothetical protein
VRSAIVEIWHCDAAGEYSGFTTTGVGQRTYLRGGQRTDAKGLASFLTIYPGWYQGRTVHIHVKVHVGGNVVHTGQLYFPDTLTDAVYRHAPYSSRPGRDTRNANDAIFRNGGSRSMLSLHRSGAGYVGAITMGVSPLIGARCGGARRAPRAPVGCGRSRRGSRRSGPGCAAPSRAGSASARRSRSSTCAACRRAP